MGQSTAIKVDERAAVVGEIEHTRNEMGEIVNAIEERLSPAHLKAQMQELKEEALVQIHDAKERLKADMRQEVVTVKSEVREATIGRMEHMVERASHRVRHAGTTVVGSVRENPIPFAMIGLGVGWLIASSRRHAGGSGYRRIDEGEQLELPASGLAEEATAFEERSFAGGEVPSYGEGVSSYEEGAPSYGEGVPSYGGHDAEGPEGRAREAVGRAADRVRNVTSQARGRAQDLAQRTRARAGRVREVGMERVHWGEERVGTFARENPPALGAILFAAGAAIGLALPRTGFESRIAGPSRQRLARKLESATKGAIESFQTKAQESLHSGREQLRQGEQQARQAQSREGYDVAEQGTPGYTDPSRIY